MTLFKALKILLRNKQIKENLAWAFYGWHKCHLESELRYFEACADRCYKHGYFEEAKAFSYMRGFLEGGSKIWIKESTLEKYHV